jgi:hypothetical protein
MFRISRYNALHLWFILCLCLNPGNIYAIATSQSNEFERCGEVAAEE